LLKHVVTIDWGDGSTRSVVNLNAGVVTFSASHQYRNNRPGNAPYPVQLTLTDSHGGIAYVTSSVAINNAAPSFVPGGTLLNPAIVPENSSTTLGVTFADSGTLDTHSVLINWGDGSDPDGDGQVGQTVNLAAGVLSLNKSHLYAHHQPGDAPYTISLT